MPRVAVSMLLLAFAAQAHAQASGSGPVYLEGNFTYQVEGNQVVMTAADIADTSATYTTNPLRLQLWLTASPYDGGTINGYLIASYSLTTNTTGILTPGESASVNATVPLTNLPVPGSYYVTMVVAEYTQGCSQSNGDTGFCSDSWGTFPTPFVIGDSNNTSSYGNLVLGQSTITADFTNDTLQFDVSSLSNTSTTYTTGSLRFEWWLTASPYAGTQMPGNRIATFTIQNASNGQLVPGKWFQDITGTVSISNLPPPGSYYASIIVSEYRQNCGSTDGWCVDTYNNYQNKQTVPAPAFSTSGSSAASSDPFGASAAAATSGGGGGGGGALGPICLMALGLLLGLRALPRR